MFVKSTKQSGAVETPQPSWLDPAFVNKNTKTILKIFFQNCIFYSFIGLHVAEIISAQSYYYLCSRIYINITILLINN